MAASSPPSEALRRPWRRSEGAGAVLGADGVGELVEGALLGGEDHGFDVAEGDAIFGEGLRVRGGQCRSFDCALRASLRMTLSFSMRCGCARDDFVSALTGACGVGRRRRGGAFRTRWR